MKFKVENMTCNHCKMRIEKALKQLGVKKIKIDLEEKMVSVVLKKHSIDEVKQAVNAIGYDFQVVEA